MKKVGVEENEYVHSAILLMLDNDEEGEIMLSEKGYQLLDHANQEVNEGNFLTSDEAKMEMDSWLKTKGGSE